MGFWCSGIPRVGFAALLAVFALAPARARAEDEGAPARLMVMADFNRDGVADLAEVAPGSDGTAALELSLGHRDGTFAPAMKAAVLGPEPRALVAGDFNRDGFTDVIVGDENGELMLLLGDGKGGLTAAGDAARLQSVVSIAVADFNRDGVPDLAVSDWRASTVTLLAGDGSGGFHRGASFALRMPGTVARVSAADFNGDGVPDLAVTYEDEDGGFMYEVMLGNGNGSFTASPQLSFMKDGNAHCAT